MAQQSLWMMDPGHPEHGLLGVVSLAIPGLWQHTVNHALDVLLAFSGLSLVLGYGVLVLALPLLLLPIAFPELSRPRDGIWSLVLAALAPLLLLNRLPVFSSAGFGELIATVLMARLAAEVGQGRWESLTPEQRTALRHLPRWRRAGADLVGAVVQAAKTAWRTTAQTAQTAWGAVLGQKDPVEQPQHGQSTSKPTQKSARKQWIRPDSSDRAQTDQDGETSPGVPDVAPEVEASAGSAVDNALHTEPAQPVDGGDGGPGHGKGADAVPGEATSEPAESGVEPPEPAAQPSGVAVDAVGPGPEAGESAPESVEPVESAQPAQPVDGGDGGPGDGKGADVVPGEATAEPAESGVEPPEPAAQPSGVAVDAVVGPGPEAGESAPEEPSAPKPAEPEPAEGVRPSQPIDGTGHPEASEANAPFQNASNSAPMDVVPEDGPADLAAEAETTEGLVAAKADAAGAVEGVTNASGTKAASTTGWGSFSNPVKDGEDVVVSSFDEVDQKLLGSS